MLGVAVRCGSLRDAETGRRWIDGSPWFWAAANGFTLGTGLLTRVGFCSWYALPLICLMPHNITVGLIAGGSYGIARTALWPIVGIVDHRRSGSLRHAANLRRFDPIISRAVGGIVAVGGALLALAAVLAFS